MMKLTKLPGILLLFATGLSWLGSGCNTSGCTDNRSSLLIAGFYSSETMRAISVDSLMIGGVGAPDDSLLVNIDDRITQVYMPLRSQSTVTSFKFHYASKALDYPELDDIVTLEYSSEPYFASEECGAVYRYRVHRLEYTRHLIDSIALPDSLINNANVERMKIFFRTANPEDPEL